MASADFDATLTASAFDCVVSCRFHTPPEAILIL